LDEFLLQRGPLAVGALEPSADGAAHAREGTDRALDRRARRLDVAIDKVGRAAQAQPRQPQRLRAVRLPDLLLVERVRVREEVDALKHAVGLLLQRVEFIGGQPAPVRLGGDEPAQLDERIAHDAGEAVARAHVLLVEVQSLDAPLKLDAPGLQGVDDGDGGGVVARTVHALAGGEALHGLLHEALVHADHGGGTQAGERGERGDGHLPGLSVAFGVVRGRGLERLSG
jgi:hypothetical protein